MDNIKNGIIEIIKDIDPTVVVDDSTELLEEILDSMSILYMIAELSKRFDCEIPMDEITIENFTNVVSIVGMMEKCLSNKQDR